MIFTLRSCRVCGAPGAPRAQVGGKKRMNWRPELSQMTRRQFVTSSAAMVAAGSLAPSAHARDGFKGQDSGASRGPFRVIIDTDPGVDDALALLLAMRSPELKIEAITPVAGNVPLDLTLPNALRMVCLLYTSRCV